jgi:hypothetical protein
MSGTLIKPIAEGALEKLWTARTGRRSQPPAPSAPAKRSPSS